jgi:hypothetical protein
MGGLMIIGNLKTVAIYSGLASMDDAKNILVGNEEEKD